MNSFNKNTFDKHIKKFLNMRESILGKIVLIFVLLLLLLIIPIIVLTYTSFQQSTAYGEMIDNIVYANRLNVDVNTEIEPVVWDIVAGKVKFEDSGILLLISNVRTRMNYIKANTVSVENSGVMEISLRALSTLEDYVDMLGRQIQERRPVDENEAVLEEIRVCVSLIDDLLQDFSSKQLNEAAALNDEMSQRSNTYFVISAFLVMFVITAGIFAFLYINKSIMNPIGSLLEMSQKISQGDFSSRVAVSASAEFNELALGMNTMSEQIEKLIEKSIDEQKQRQLLEVKALQAQITPHFLYNTLDAIIWAAEDKNIGDVKKLVTSLSSFFRISLSHGIDFITISNEIAHVRSYLIIQQIRYSDILSYEINVDKGLDDYLILKLLLQPLVENAIYHGIKNTRERGHVTISVKRIGEGGVCFSVSDNGIGMTEPELFELRQALEGGGDNNSLPKGYGLFNVNRRIKLYYNLSEGIEVQSEYKRGTTVSFTLWQQRETPSF